MNINVNEVINAGDFLGKYLVKEDIEGERVVTLTDVRAEAVRNASRRKLVAIFAEYRKPLVLNTTNIKRLSAFFGSPLVSKWRGPVTLYVDESVEYAGNTVGGIRLRPAGVNGTGVGHEENMYGTTAA